MRSGRRSNVLALIGALMMTLALSCQAVTAPTPNASAPADQLPSASATANQGGTVVVGIFQEPDTLFAYASRIFQSYYISTMFSAPLIRVNDQGQLEPFLAAEIPSLANGGISPDGKTVTLRLRKNARWEDGAPVTSKDFVYTWKAIMDKTSAVPSTVGWDRITGIDTPDEQTAVIHLRSLHVAFVTSVLAGQFGGRLLAEHVYGKVSNIPQSNLGRKPFGNGPFRFVEWVSADHITLERNPNFWGDKPLLDRVIFKIVPDPNVSIAQLRAGQIDIGTEMTPANVEELRAVPGVVTLSAPSTTIERITLQLNNPKDLSKPHPILSELAVRQAIAFGTNRQAMVDSLLFGQVKQAVTEQSNTPYFNQDLSPYPYDPQRAKKLLDDAGWIPGANGIRVKNGIPLRLTATTTIGVKVRESMQAIIQQQLKDIGFDIQIQNYNSTQLFAGCAQGGINQTRQWEILLGSTGLSLDPDPTNFFHSKDIPDCKTKPVGDNRHGFNTPELDALLEAQQRELDVAKRKQILNQVQKIIYDAIPMIYLYPVPNIAGVNKRVQGIKPLAQFSGSIFWNVEKWSVTDGK